MRELKNLKPEEMEALVQTLKQNESARTKRKKAGKSLKDLDPNLGQGSARITGGD